MTLVLLAPAPPPSSEPLVLCSFAVSLGITLSPTFTSPPSQSLPTNLHQPSIAKASPLDHHKMDSRTCTGFEIPWDLKKAQPALEKAEQEGMIKGLVRRPQPFPLNLLRVRRKAP